MIYKIALILLLNILITCIGIRFLKKTKRKFLFVFCALLSLFLFFIFYNTLIEKNITIYISISYFQFNIINSSGDYSIRGICFN